MKRTYFIADKSYDLVNNHNFIRDVLNGHAFTALNKRGTKNKNSTSKGNIICDGGLAMHKDGRQYFNSYIKQKFCCLIENQKMILYVLVSMINILIVKRIDVVLNT